MGKITIEKTILIGILNDNKKTHTKLLEECPHIPRDENYLKVKIRIIDNMLKELKEIY